MYSMPFHSKYLINGLSLRYNYNNTNNNKVMVSYPILPYSIIPYPTLSYTTLLYYMLPYPTLPYVYSDDEMLALKFVSDITSDVIDRGVFSNRVVKQVFARHVANNQGKLKEVN